MIVGVPREIKPEEHRVAVTPELVSQLTTNGHQVLIEESAGSVSSISDADFAGAGAAIAPTAAAVFESADLIVKVKEPQQSEVELLKPGQTIFTFLHLAAYPKLAEGLVKAGVTALAYETVETPTGDLPLLAPMSEIAGRMATQAGAHYLERPQGGRGILIGGVRGAPSARVIVLGAGHAGTHATMVAAAMGAEVVVLDLKPEKLGAIDAMGLGGVTTVVSDPQTLEDAVLAADLVIGAVLVPGARAPVVVSDAVVQAMRPRSVVVDISIDQGGCFATSRETTHADPVYEKHGVLHYAVGNIPGAVPNTATFALTYVTQRYVLALADGLDSAMATYPELVAGINVASGRITHSAVAGAVGAEWVPAAEALDA